MDAADTVIWQRALARSAIIITKDEDFALRTQLGRSEVRVVWIRYGNVRKAELLRRFAMVWPSVVDALDRDEALVEIA